MSAYFDPFYPWTEESLGSVIIDLGDFLPIHSSQQTLPCSSPSGFLHPTKDILTWSGCWNPCGWWLSKLIISLGTGTPSLKTEECKDAMLRKRPVCTKQLYLGQSRRTFLHHNQPPTTRQQDARLFELLPTGIAKSGWRTDSPWPQINGGE